MSGETPQRRKDRRGSQEPPSSSYLAGIYHRHVNTVYRLCHSFLGNGADAEDATQSVFARLMENPRRFNGEEHEKAWLIVAAQNHCRDLLKSAYRTRVSAQSDELLEQHAPADGSSEDALAVQDAVFRLPDKYKTCVYLHYYEGYRSQEISRIIGVPDSTVRNYLSEARQLLKAALGDRRQ